jgi:hypothetical protein
MAIKLELPFGAMHLRTIENPGLTFIILNIGCSILIGEWCVNSELTEVGVLFWWVVQKWPRAYWRNRRVLQQVVQRRNIPAFARA